MRADFKETFDDVKVPLLAIECWFAHVQERHDRDGGQGSRINEAVAVKITHHVM